MDITYKVGDLKRLISEGFNESKPKFGDGVEKANKSINDKAYEDSKKRAEDYNGGLKKEEDFARGDAKYEKKDGNHTTLGYNPENASPEYKKRIKAQALGYTSEQEKNNGIEKSGDYSDNEDIFDGITKSEKEMDDNLLTLKRSGLQASKMPKSNFEKDTLYESQDGVDMRQAIDAFKANFHESKLDENKKLKTVYFKKTQFLTEGHMLSKIPDEFKNEGNQFKMKDKTGNEYIVEWTNNKGEIIGHTNKQGLIESLDKMNSLMNFKSTTSHSSKNESFICESNSDKSLSATLDIMRKINNLNK